MPSEIAQEIVSYQGFPFPKNCRRTCPVIMENIDRESFEVDLNKLSTDAVAMQCPGRKKLGETECSVTYKCPAANQEFKVC